MDRELAGARDSLCAYQRRIERGMLRTSVLFAALLAGGAALSSLRVACDFGLADAARYGAFDRVGSSLVAALVLVGMGAVLPRWVIHHRLGELLGSGRLVDVEVVEVREELGAGVHPRWLGLLLTAVQLLASRSICPGSRRATSSRSWYLGAAAAQGAVQLVRSTTSS